MQAQADKYKATITLPTDDQIMITREFDAPRHLVYRAWTTPELVKRWFGGSHGEPSVVEIDLRVGGRWRYAFRPADAFHGEYRQIVARRADRLDRGLRGRARRRGSQHAHADRARRADDDDRARPASEQGQPGRPHQRRHGAGHERGPGQARGGRPLAGRGRPPGRRYGPVAAPRIGRHGRPAPPRRTAPLVPRARAGGARALARARRVRRVGPPPAGRAALGLLRGAADRKRPARLPSRPQPGVQGHLPALPDDDWALRRA